MSNLTAYDQAVRLAQANETFWSQLGASTPKTSPLGQRLGAFFRDVWNPWYARILLITAHPLTDAQQAQFAHNVARQLTAIRDDAGYRYQLPMIYDDAHDAQLGDIEEDSAFYLEGIAANAGGGSRGVTYGRLPAPARPRAGAH